MLRSYYQKGEQNHNLMTANKSLENVAKFKYLETTVTDKTCIHEVTKKKSNMGNACYH